MILAEELRARANDMREKGMWEWAYLCLTAADRIALLEAENQRLREALTPSTDTKLAYWGSDEVEGSSWQAMKTLMQAIRKRALLQEQGE
jgi:hypothetical protein